MAAPSRGLAFQLAGTKRSAPSVPPKKPVSVKDLFSGDSDSDDEQPVKTVDAKKSRVAPGPEPIAAAPADPEVKRAADKLAEFVARNGRGFEEVTRQRNSGDRAFRFLLDTSSPEYKYYEHKIKEFSAGAAAVAAPSGAGAGGSQASGASSTRTWDAPASIGSMRPAQPFHAAAQSSSVAAHSHPGLNGQAKQVQPATGDSVAAMQAYMHMVARKEKRQQQGQQQDTDSDEEDAAPRTVAHLKETAFDRRKVTAVLKPDGARGHHMQDFIPQEEMAKFLTKCGDKHSTAAAAVLEQKAAIGADNIGHKLLQKMGWKEGQGIGSAGTGLTAPIQAAGVKQDNLGVGAAAVGDVGADDDIYEQYRKRMMLGYKFRPNPLGNPRKAYY